MWKIKNIQGQKFGRLTVVSLYGKDKNGKALWKCKCDCGKEHITSASSLQNGNTKSCGCLKNEVISKLNRKDGRTKERLYKIWLGMFSRCYNKNLDKYKIYGMRGIKVCDEWRDYKNFRSWALSNGYIENSTQKECSIDRIDVNGNYCPENCRWATAKEQSNNTRFNVFWEFNGKKKTVAQWADELNVNAESLYRRKYRGWTIEKILTTPIRKQGKRSEH